MTNDNHGNDGSSSSTSQPPTDVDNHRQRSARASTDTLHRLLANERRRHLLRYLTRRPGETVPVDDIIDGITRRERPDPAPAPHRDRVAIDLHHVHLPKLANADVIELDPVAETVRYVGPEALASLLTATGEIDDHEE